MQKAKDWSDYEFWIKDFELWKIVFNTRETIFIFLQKKFFLFFVCFMIFVVKG